MLFVSHIIHPNILMSSHAQGSHHSPQHLHVQPCQRLTLFTPTSSHPQLMPFIPKSSCPTTPKAHATHPSILTSHHIYGSHHSLQHPHVPSHLRLTSFTATSSCPIRSTAHIIHFNIHMSHYIHSSHHLLQHSHVQPCPRLTLHSNNLINPATPKAHTSFSNI